MFPGPGRNAPGLVCDDGLRMISPVVTHAACALDFQSRLRTARVESVARSVGRTRRPAWFRRPRVRERSADLAAGLGRRGEDVWTALRA